MLDSIPKKRYIRRRSNFPAVCKKCAKVCRAPENGKSHDESYDSSWDFGALEGTRIPGPLIKSQMLYRLSYERIFRSKTYCRIILPQLTAKSKSSTEKSGNSRANARDRGGRGFPMQCARRQPAGLCLRLSASAQRGYCRLCFAPKAGVWSAPSRARSRRADKTARGGSVPLLYLRYDKMVKPKFR